MPGDESAVLLYPERSDVFHPKDTEVDRIGLEVFPSKRWLREVDQSGCASRGRTVAQLEEVLWARHGDRLAGSPVPFQEGQRLRLRVCIVGGVA
jgi:hypothetical protein